MINTSQDLKDLLFRINRKSYPAYKDTKGSYRFPGYVLSIDHVQGDPFAAPSKLSLHIKGAQAGFAEALYATREMRIALQDQLIPDSLRILKNTVFAPKVPEKAV